MFQRISQKEKNLGKSMLLIWTIGEYSHRTVNQY